MALTVRQNLDAGKTPITGRTVCVTPYRHRHRRTRKAWCPQQRRNTVETFHQEATRHLVPTLQRISKRTPATLSNVFSADLPATGLSVPQPISGAQPHIPQPQDSGS